MFRSRLFSILRSCNHSLPTVRAVRTCRYVPVALGFLSTAFCEADHHKKNATWDDVSVDRLEHDFLIRQATTNNVNAATQLLTVTLVAIQDTSERLRDALTKEICLVNQALEWGEEGTPPHHWDQLVAVRGVLGDLNHNLRTLLGYMDYAEKLATVAAEISYLSGNIAASDAICERIDHACRTCNVQKQLTHDLQKESLELQQKAIMNSPNLKDKLESQNENTNNKCKPKS